MQFYCAHALQRYVLTLSLALSWTDGQILIVIAITVNTYALNCILYIHCILCVLSWHIK